MNLMDLLTGMQGAQGGQGIPMQHPMQGMQPQGQQQMQGPQANPMSMAMFGNMPFLNLPQPRGPGPMPQGGGGSDLGPLSASRPQPQQGGKSWHDIKTQGWTPATDGYFK